MPKISQLIVRVSLQAQTIKLWNPRPAPVLADHSGPGMVLEKGGSAVHPSPDLLGAFITLQQQQWKEAVETAANKKANNHRMPCDCAMRINKVG